MILRKMKTSHFTWNKKCQVRHQSEFVKPTWFKNLVGNVGHIFLCDLVSRGKKRCFLQKITINVGFKKVYVNRFAAYRGTLLCSWFQKRCTYAATWLIGALHPSVVSKKLYVRRFAVNQRTSLPLCFLKNWLLPSDILNKISQFSKKCLLTIGILK